MMEDEGGIEEKVDRSLEEYLMEYLVSCEKCHLCNADCPVCDHRVTHGPFGINRAIYYGMKWNQFTKELRDLVYSCTTCGRCAVRCKQVSRALPLVELFEKAREWLLVEKMIGPMPEQRNVLKNIYRRGNPWGFSPQERTKWAEGLNVSYASPKHHVEVLYYVGCTTSYDPQGQKIAKNLSTILKRGGINFGILENEQCSGSEPKRMGEPGLFEYLAEGNLKMFEEAGIGHIVTGDPHSFYSFSREYPDRIKGLKIEHYSQFLGRLIDEKKLSLSTRVPKKVSYHDPCYLGRKSEVFEEPRKLIQKIPGVEFVEMEKCRENSDCCGMGGGRMWMELPKGLVSSQLIAEKRVQQALDTGAEILLTACPFCNITLTDAVKGLAKEDSLKVMDITEVIAMSI
jgi:Fe-S oxidoreductase